MQKIGVFVCWCGSNIAATVDVKAVAEAARKVPGVVFSADYQYMCSEAGQGLIKDAIKEHGLTGVVVCSCSPRMHEATFRKAVQAVGLNPYMLEVANIREQCSWVHKDMATATEKAIALMQAAVAKVTLNTPLTAGTTPVTKRALPDTKWISWKRNPPLAVRWPSWIRHSLRWTVLPVSSRRRWLRWDSMKRSTSILTVK